MVNRELFTFTKIARCEFQTPDALSFYMQSLVNQGLSKPDPDALYYHPTHFIPCDHFCSQGIKCVGIGARKSLILLTIDL
jgi:hypothetical protein